MIDDNTKDNLFDIYFIIRKKSGWLADCLGAGYTKEDIEFLESLDDEFSSYDSSRDLKEFEKSIEREGGNDLLEISDEDKLKELHKKIFIILEYYRKLFKEDGEYINRLFYLKNSKLDEYKKLATLIRGKQIYKDHPEGITEREISIAKEFPLSRLLGKEGRIPCPFHVGDNNNFLINENYGYCFKCGEWADSIKWLMKIDGLNFVDAVKKLSK